MEPRIAKAVPARDDATPRDGVPVGCQICPYCGGKAWFNSPVPDEKPCSCQACGGTGLVPAEH